MLRAKSSRIVRGNSFQSLSVFALKAAGGLSSYLLFALIARLCGPDEFGAFSIIFSAAMIAGIAGSLGQQVFLVKEVAKAQQLEDSTLAMKTYTFSFMTTVLGALATCVLFFAVVRTMYPGGGYLVAIGGATLVLTFALSQTTLGALRVLGQVVLAVGSRDLVWRILAAGSIALLPWIFPSVHINAGIALAAMSSTLAMIVVWHWRIIRAQLTSKLDFQNIFERRWLRLTAGLALVAVISSADLYVFSIVLGYIVPVDEVGPFFAAMKTVEVINLLLMSVALVIGPNIARAVAEGCPRRVQIQCNVAILIQGAPACIACIVVIAFAPEMLMLFDSSFERYANVLCVLTIGVLINALAGPTVLFLQLIDLHWRQVILQGGSLLIALSLLPILVHNYGLVGAAYCYVLSKVVWNAAAILSSRIRAGVDPSVLGLFGFGALNIKDNYRELRNLVVRKVND